MIPELIEQIAFEEADEAAWRRLVDKALKGIDFDEALVSKSADGIAYGPIAGRDAGGVLHPRNEPEAPWTVSQRVDDPDAGRAAAQLEADLDGGATGLTLCIAGAPAAHGFGIDAGQIGPLLAAIGQARGSASRSGRGGPWFELRFEAPAEHFAAILDAVEPFAEDDRRHVDFGLAAHEPAASGMDALVERAFDLDIACTIFRADGRIVHNAGASEAQELGFVMAALAETLRLTERLEIDAESALAASEIALAADQDQFLTTAKLRAARRLHARLLEVLEIPEPFAAHVHAETSWRMLTKRDPETNILRNTIAVFAAGIGGADSISVLPHTFAHGLPDRFARRIARNTQTVLIDESHLAHVVDPSAGAGGIEQLTAALAEKAWGEFQAIEREGGLAKSLAGGGIAARIADTRRKRAEALAAGGQPIVGTTVYAPQAERPVSVLIEPHAHAVIAGLAPSPLDAAAEGGAA